MATAAGFLYEVCCPRPAMFGLEEGRWILAIYCRRTGRKVAWRTDLESAEHAETAAQRHHRFAVMSG